jgi:hypothetical protein
MNRAWQLFQDREEDGGGIDNDSFKERKMAAATTAGRIRYVRFRIPYTRTLLISSSLRSSNAVPVCCEDHLSLLTTASPNFNSAQRTKRSRPRAMNRLEGQTVR